MSTGVRIPKAIRDGHLDATYLNRVRDQPFRCPPEMPPTVNDTATATATTALANLESSLSEIFLAVGDFLEFNARTSSLYPPVSHPR
jgi:hypothetical protein